MHKMPNFKLKVHIEIVVHWVSLSKINLGTQKSLGQLTSKSGNGQAICAVDKTTYEIEWGLCGDSEKGTET